ncbi:MAG: hypothetical protein IJP32_05190 [Clostridia bacterium]|nr:hypothetical protein [Clostridia bacterium]
MAQSEKFSRYNRVLLEKMSIFLNCEPDFVQESIIDELCTDCGLTKEEAFAFVLSAAVGLDTENVPADRELFERYFPDMLRLLDYDEFAADPYLHTVTVPEKTEGTWELKYEAYKPYEAFACGDLRGFSDGRVVPQIGFFAREFRYPAVLENGREWMLITPNEIVTMREPVRRAHGKVLTFGLGLGYFAFMAARKPEVSSVTVVERDRNVMKLFETYIRPQLPCADKITVLHDDAYRYAEKRMKTGKYDFVFADIWHDPSDGVAAYRKLKKYERLLPKAEFMYWIEPTLQFYL